MIGALKEFGTSASRSSALQSPIRIILALLATFVGCLKMADSEWLCIFLLVLVTVTLIFSMCVYWHFAKVNPDALRSERFILRKLELGLQGDSESGVRRFGTSKKALSDSSLESIESEDNEK